MGDSTISALPSAVTISGADVFPIDQAGVTRKATIFQLPGNPAALAAPGGAGLVGVTPAGGIASTTVAAALNELDTKKIPFTTLAMSSGSSLVGYSQGSSGSSVITQQAKNQQIVNLTEFPLFSDFLAAALHSGFYTDTGAKLITLTDRVFVGGAVNNDGTSAQTNNDWLSTYQNSVSRPGGPAMHFATLGVLNNTSPNASSSFVAGSQNKFLPTSTNGIAISGYGLNNNTVDSSSFTYAGYFEAVRAVSALGGAYASEFDVVNYGSLATTDPYQQPSAQTIGLQVAAGAQFPAIGQAACSAAINIRNNNAAFTKGIVFGSTSIAGANGTSGTGIAIALGLGHVVQWYSNLNSVTSSLYCSGNATASATSQVFGNNGTLFSNVGNGQAVFQLTNAVNPVNHLAINATATGSNSVNINAYGSDANIDIQLFPQGTGVLSFGTYTAGVVSQAGYVSIKDSGGTVRRLLVG